MKLTQYCQILNSRRSTKTPGNQALTTLRIIIFIITPMEEKEEHRVTNIKTPSRATEAIDHIIETLIKNIRDGRISIIKKITKVIKLISKEDTKVTKNLWEIFNNFSKVNHKDNHFGKTSKGRDSSMRRKSLNSEAQFEDHSCLAYFCLCYLLSFCHPDPRIQIIRTHLTRWTNIHWWI